MNFKKKYKKFLTGRNFNIMMVDSKTKMGSIEDITINKQEFGNAEGIGIHRRKISEMSLNDLCFDLSYKGMIITSFEDYFYSYRKEYGVTINRDTMVDVITMRWCRPKIKGMR